MQREAGAAGEAAAQRAALAAARSCADAALRAMHRERQEHGAALEYQRICAQQACSLQGLNPKPQNLKQQACSLSATRPTRQGPPGAVAPRELDMAHYVIGTRARRRP